MSRFTSFVVKWGKVISVEHPDIFPDDIIDQEEKVAQHILEIDGYVQYDTKLVGEGAIRKKFMIPRANFHQDQTELEYVHLKEEK